MNGNKGLLMLAVLVSLGAPAVSRAAGGTSAKAKLTAAQIVEKHVAARGGLKAWRGVQSMTWQGQMEIGSGDSVARSASYVSAAMSRKNRSARAASTAESKDEARKQVQVPFTLEMKRPGRSRIELEFGGKTAVQIYDGSSGWLLRPYLNREDWEPFSAEQTKSQQGKWEVEGPLLDYAAKGTKVDLAGVEQVEGHDAYKLKLTRKGGEVEHVWIDAKTFLDVRVEGTPRKMDGKLHTVRVTQRDFRSVQGLLVPFVLETTVDGYPDTHQMIIEKVSFNPRLDDSRFVKPRA